MRTEPALVSDFAEVRALLEASQLPISDLNEASLRHFLVIRQDNSVVGVAGIEVHGRDGLLRSVAVTTTQRGHGLGAKLTAGIEALAQSLPVSTLFLLTTTAAPFFTARGFKSLPRSDVPESIRNTTEFASLCPSTAIVMSKSIETPVLNVLFLCTGNSARSILAEAALNRLGSGRFRAFSAGSFPKGQVNPYALELLNELGLPTAGLRSKSWDEFAGSSAPQLDFIFTVCDNAAGEVCPIWPGKPVSAHWGIEDPAAVEGSPDAKRRAFKRALQELEARIAAFLALPFASLDAARLKQHLDQIGSLPGSTRG